MLYLRSSTRDASPKAISGRTSYLRVRLAYHPYPQLIPSFCNISGFGPPRAVRLASPWPWVAHPVSCLILATDALFRLAFATARGVSPLAWPQGLTRRLILQEARRQALAARGRFSPAHRPAISPSTACKLTVSGSLSLPSPGYFSPFPHGTGSLSVAKCI